VIDGVGALERPAGDIELIVDKRPLDGLDRPPNADVKEPFIDFRHGVSRHLAAGSIAQCCNDRSTRSPGGPPGVEWRHSFSPRKEGS
jgi:hypothetical protein